MSLTTTVGEARPKSKSLRVTIPNGMVAYLDLKAGDEVEWKMENLRSGERVAMMRKAKIVQ
jgi:antitoxin component of MazEF toxin-antitoxin module